uniref:NADH-ubiquinone oxidoreductase chain 2 n=1 Tax=Dolichovespula xanthicincta TaxID=2982222 RepID=A0A977SPA8_9HYME|nr:NADH dehydrogenase subunit 2 [Dolichovespula xanthicincta]
MPKNFLTTSNALFYSMFLFMVLLSILSVALTNFIHLWLLMEINTLIFISMMAMNSKNFKATFNFFLIQSISSMIMIFLMVLKNNLLTLNMFEWVNFMLILSFSMKIGLFPFFYWPPLINTNLNWLMILLISTTQKFIPLMLLNLFINSIFDKSTNFLLLLLASLSSLSSTIMCMNEVNIKKIMTYSSLNHLSWMIFIIIFDISLFLVYFLFYTISMQILCFFLNKFNINTFFNFIKFQSFNYKEFNFFLTLNFLIISALPPFLTFIIKISAIKVMIEGMSLFSSFIFSLLSMFTLIFYMNVIIKMNLFSMIKTKFYFTYNLNLKFNYYLSILLSFMSLSFLFIFYTMMN